jgi:hypothetical protein
MRWVWSLNGALAAPPGVHPAGHAPTLEAAKAELKASWRKWLAWAKLGEMA